MAFPSPLASRGAVVVRIALFLATLFVFLTAIELLSTAFKEPGKEYAAQLFQGLQNPFAGLAVGVLATVMVQSSSVTTSTVVALVGSGALSLECAVPVVMGANIGTTITCTIVSMGNVTQSLAFRRAFAGATLHDFFNVATVVILFPLELATGIIHHAAVWLVDLLPHMGGADFDSPIKTSVQWSVSGIRLVLERGLGLSNLPLAAVMFILALGLIIGSLILITRNMRALMADHIETWLNRVLKRSGLLGLAAGIVITMGVQSSSITTSLLVPLFGAGIITLETGFPIMVGANLGTTITALLASTVAGPAGLTIAVVHLLFNLLGTVIFFPVPRMRMIPIWCAQRLADAATRNPLYVIAYVLAAFVLIPLAGIFIWRG